MSTLSVFVLLYALYVLQLHATAPEIKEMQGNIVIKYYKKPSHGATGYTTYSFANLDSVFFPDTHTEYIYDAVQKNFFQKKAHGAGGGRIKKNWGTAVKDHVEMVWSRGAGVVIIGKQAGDFTLPTKTEVEAASSAHGAYKNEFRESTRMDLMDAADARMELMDQYYYDGEVEEAREELAVKRLERERARASLPIPRRKRSKNQNRQN
eukprot:115758_1